MEALDAIGKRENTIVVYTSDHGEMLGSHGLMSKNVPYEEATAIPFIIRYPARLTHRIEPLFLSAVDMMPTILGLSDINVPNDAAGKDYSKLLTEDTGNRPQSVLFTQPKRKGVRTDKYLFTVSYKNEKEWGETMLFDTQSDPYQMSNLRLSDIPKSDMQMLCRELGKWLKKSNDPWFKKKLYDDLIIYPQL